MGGVKEWWTFQSKRSHTYDVGCHALDQKHDAGGPLSWRPVAIVSMVRVGRSQVIAPSPASISKRCCTAAWRPRHETWPSSG